jgi:hypothetical protein
MPDHPPEVHQDRHVNPSDALPLQPPPVLTPTDLELYGESHMLSLFRHYMPTTDYTNPNAVRPNYDFGLMIESAMRVLARSSTCSITMKVF